MSYTYVTDVLGNVLLDSNGDPLLANMGPDKRVLIQRAYGVCGQSFTEFELSPEEMTAGLQLLNDVMGDLLSQGLNLGYNFPAINDGDPEDESGISKAAVRAVVYELAEALAPTIGKELSTQAKAVHGKAMSSLRSIYMTIPQMEMGRYTPRGTGGRRRTFGPFFVTDVSSTEPSQ